MNPKTEAALRTLARTSSGPFRAIAYGLASSAEAEPALGRELRSLLKKEGASPEAELFIESADPFGPAIARTTFRREILARIEPPSGRKRSPPALLTGRAAPARARQRLADVAADVPRLLQDVDQRLEAFAKGEPTSAQPVEGSISDPEITEHAVIESDSSDSVEKLAWLVLLRNYEELGRDAEVIAQSIDAVITRGAHMVITSEGLDTRTRDGRAVARTALRLGALKSEGARERSLADVVHRRATLRVYGPVPFGFERRGQELAPLEGEIATVKRVRELTGYGQSPIQIAATLNHEKRVWRDGTPWTWRRVDRVLKNPIYVNALRGGTK